MKAVRLTVITVHPVTEKRRLSVAMEKGSEKFQTQKNVFEQSILDRDSPQSQTSLGCGSTRIGNDQSVRKGRKEGDFGKSATIQEVQQVHHPCHRQNMLSKARTCDAGMNELTISLLVVLFTIHPIPAHSGWACSFSQPINQLLHS